MKSYQTEDVWMKTRKLIKVGFWGLNIGMALMVVVDLFPSGILQLWDSINNGYWHARSLHFIMSGFFHKLEWIRLGADAIFIFLGVLPTVTAFLITYWEGRRHDKKGRELDIVFPSH